MNVTNAQQLEFEIKKLSNQHTDWSLPVIVIKTLLDFTRQYKFKTFQEFMQTLQVITAKLEDENISYNAGIGLFTRHCARECATDLQGIIEGVEHFIENCGTFRDDCIRLGKKVIMPKSSILLHSYSTMATRY